MPRAPWTRDGHGITLAIRVTPRASRSGLGAGRDGQFAARLAAPPVDGAANAALVALVAEGFGVPRRAVTILAGERGRTKRVRVEGEPGALESVAASLYGAGS